MRLQLRHGLGGRERDRGRVLTITATHQLREVVRRHVRRVLHFTLQIFAQAFDLQLGLRWREGRGGEGGEGGRRDDDHARERKTERERERERDDEEGLNWAVCYVDIELVRTLYTKIMFLLARGQLVFLGHGVCAPSRGRPILPAGGDGDEEEQGSTHVGVHNHDDSSDLLETCVYNRFALTYCW